MKKHPLLTTVVCCCLFLFPFCKKDQPKNDPKDISSFVFRMADNPGIKSDVFASIHSTDDTIRVSFPQGTDVTHLVPTIVYDGSAISPGNKIAANFSTNVRYTVTAKDGSSKTYIVVIRLLSDAKAILSFVFRAADNPGLSADINGIISKDTIHLYIDPTVDLTHLVPTISYTGTRVTPGNGTAQNFSSPIQYSVTAEDGNSIDYTIIVSGNVTVFVGSEDNYLYALDAATGALRWKAATNGLVISSPTLAGGTVYVGSDDQYLYAFNALTGEMRWKAFTEGPVEGNPTVAGGMVYVDNNSAGSYLNSALTAFDTATGAQQWRYNIQAIYSAQSPTVINGVVYLTSPFSSPGLGAFDAKTGVEQWENRTEIGSRWNPAVVNGTIYVGGVYHPMQAVDLQTHTVKWEYIDRDPVNNGTIIIGGNGSPTVDGSTVFVPTHNNDMYAIDAATGALKWKFSTSNTQPSSQFSSPVAGKGLLFAANNNGLLYALDETTGVIRWTYVPTSGIGQGSANPTLANGILYTGSAGKVCAIDALTGALKWAFTTGGAVYSGPCVIDAKGNISHPGVSGDHQ